jgi:hypothetical protein
LPDESQIGKMRDVYPISILRFENLLALIGAGKFTEALMLLPITLFLNAVRVDTFARDTRKDLLRQCFHIVRLMMAQKQYHRGRTGILVDRGKRGDTVTPLQERTATQILHTVLTLLDVCDRVSDIAVGRLSSHPVENFFGVLRRSVHDAKALTQIVTATAGSTIVTWRWRRLGLVDHIHTRIGNSSVKIFQGEASDPAAMARVTSVALPEPIADPRLLACILLGHCAFDESLIESPILHGSGGFLMYVEYLTAMYNVTTVSNIRNEPSIRVISISGRRPISLLRDHNLNANDWDSGSGARSLPG